MTHSVGDRGSFRPQAGSIPSERGEHDCGVCTEALAPGDLCASDIDLGICHAKCLEGSPVVDLETGEEKPGSKLGTFVYGEVVQRSAHTSGPWRVWPDYAGRADPHLLVGPGQFDTIASVRMGHDELDGDLAANARLIAAAPDGLDAAVSAYIAMLSAVDVRHRFQPQLCALRDFIAKATGRDPQDVQDEYDGMVLAAIQSATGEG